MNGLFIRAYLFHTQKSTVMKLLSILPKGLLAFAAFAAFTLVSCKKDNTSANAGTSVSEESTMSAAADETVANSQFDDVFNSAVGIDDATAGDDVGISGSDGLGVYGRTAVNSKDASFREDSSHRCFTVTVIPKDRGSFPKTITIDFGNGCLGIDGKLRKGKIITVYTGKMHIPGSTATTSFDGYYVDSFHIEGVHIVQNTSSSNQKEFTVKVQDGKITNMNNGKWVSWTKNRVHTQVEGNGTPLWPFDDVYNISGTSNGSNSNGTSWSTEISSALVWKFICYWIVEGKVNITVNGSTGVLDYGDGNCDNKATITVNGHVREIRLR